MAKTHSTRRSAGSSPSKKSRAAAKRQEAERRQAKLLAIRDDARAAVKEPPMPPNRLAGALGLEDTLGNVQQVMRFLEYCELNETSEEVESGRWHIQQWLNDALEYAEAQRKREADINACIVMSLHASGASS